MMPYPTLKLIVVMCIFPTILNSFTVILIDDILSLIVLCYRWVS